MKKFVRSRIDSRIAGVCGGLSYVTDIDANILRLLFIAAIFTPLPIIIFYMGCWIMIPKETF